MGVGGDLPGTDFYNASMSAETKEMNFVFVLGIMPRSGTHFLMNLLCLHPECAQSAMPEDGLVARSNILMKYIAENYRQWELEGDLPQIEADKLLVEGLGRGLLTFLKEARSKAIDQGIFPQAMPGLESHPKYMVAKTPSVSNLKNFFRLFPQQKLLILVRDGRSLVESINLSFGYDREEAMRDWANAARNIFNMQKKWKAEGRQFLIVKYEELYMNTDREMKNIFSFLGLSSEKYDFKKALNLPVVGSSIFKRNGKVHWQPVDKTHEFNPMDRSAGWTRWQHERFNWLASNELILFGYEPVAFRRRSMVIVARNHVYDLFYTARLWGKRFPKFIYFVLQRLKLHFKNDGTNS